MTVDAAFEQNLSARLEEEHSLLRALLLVLGQVRSALLDGLAVDQMLQDKQQLLEKLELLTTARMQLLREHGFGGGANLATELSSQRCSGRLLEEYRSFENTARACQVQNQALGQLAKRREGFVLRALNALRGTPTPAAIYSGNGLSSGSGAARWLGSA